MLATDGLWDHLSNEDVAGEVAGHLRSAPLPLAAARTAAADPAGGTAGGSLRSGAFRS